MVEGIDLHELETGVAKDLGLGDGGKDFFHHRVKARITIMVGCMQHLAIGIEQGIVHAPGVDPDTPDVSRAVLFAGAFQARYNRAPEILEFPVEVAVDLRGAIFKAMHGFEFEFSIGENPADDPAATGAEIDGKVNGCRVHHRGFKRENKRLKAFPSIFLQAPRAPT